MSGNALLALGAAVVAYLALRRAPEGPALEGPPPEGPPPEVPDATEELQLPNIFVREGGLPVANGGWPVQDFVLYLDEKIASFVVQGGTYPAFANENPTATEFVTAQVVIYEPGFAMPGTASPGPDWRGVELIEKVLPRADSGYSERRLGYIKHVGGGMLFTYALGVQDPLPTAFLAQWGDPDVPAAYWDWVEP